MQEPRGGGGAGVILHRLHQKIFKFGAIEALFVLVMAELCIWKIGLKYENGKSL